MSDFDGEGIPVEALIETSWEEVQKELVPIWIKARKSEDEQLRQAAAEQASALVDYLATQNEAKARIAAFQVFMPHLQTLLVDSVAEVRALSIDALIAIARIFPKDQLHIINTLVDLCSDERQEHVRLDAVRLVQRLSPLVSEHEATSQLVPIWLKLAKDDSHAVRKAVAEVNTLFFRVSDDVFTEGLLRRFRKFCSDRIWSVRKAAVESMVKLSERCSPAQRSDLVPLYEKLLEDESRWVKSAAYQAIGPFIATLGRTDKLDTLLAYFRRMVFNQAAIGDSDAMSYCAFSFPGVLLTVGPDDWAKLQDIYEALTNSLLWKVRKTLAHSLHEIAKLLGIERTEEVLLPTFDKYLKDLDEVKVGVLKHFPQFLEYVRPETRTQYISICHDIQKDTLNWRFRKLIARDLAVLCRLFGPEVTISDLLPIAVDLLQDPVAVVRQTANASVGRVFEVLSSGQQNPAMAERFLDKLTEFGQDNYFISRQIFVHACASASQTVPPATLKEKLLPSLIRLADDKVPNVRLLVARTLSQLSRSPEFQTEEVTKALEKLKLDRDRDVVNEAQSVH